MGFLALGYCAFLWGRAQYDQAQGRWALEHILPGDPAASGASRRPPSSAEGSLVGRIDIPRLDLSAVVFEGTSDDTLARGVGHLRGSAEPGERGNLVLAGHRDTFFRHIYELNKGDQIQVRRNGRTYTYEVTGRKVVMPEDISVIKPTNNPQLTLITCYPTYYIGPAPKRLVVFSKLVDSDGQPVNQAAQARATAQ